MDRPKNPFLPPQGRFLADDSPMLKVDNAAQVRELRACLDGTTVVEPRRQAPLRPGGSAQPLPVGQGQQAPAEWEPSRPLEAPRGPTPPQIRFSRTWDQQRGRGSSFPARPAGRILSLWRARQLF